MLTSQLFHGQLDSVSTRAIVVGLYDNGQLNDAAKALDKIIGGKIEGLFLSKDHEGDLAKAVTLYHVNGIKAERIIVVGLGNQDNFSVASYRKVIAASVNAVKSQLDQVVITLADMAVKDHNTLWQYQQAVQVAHDVLYKIDQFKTDEKSKKPNTLDTVLWWISDKNDQQQAQQGINIGEAVAKGVSTTKELGNLPANYCTPTFLAEQAKAIAAQYDFSVEVFDKAEIEALGMGAFLSVAKGSDEPPKFIVLSTGKSAPEKPIALVGKGITFDTGGISLKPANGMEEMIFDMCGAATVLGVFRAIGEMNLNVNVVGIVPTCENMPSGKATRPGDIVTSMSGKSIEVINTDAEGRLILSDALSYALRYEPSAIIDMATLTGACIVALGYEATGLMSNNDDLANALLDAGEYTYDRAWRLPLWSEYQEIIKGHYADIINSAGRDAGTITAGCFLSNFVEKYPWAHLDIAGTASTSGKKRGATGRPVPLIMQYLMTQAKGA